MPFDGRNLGSTLRKNNTDLADAIWFGALYQQMIMTNTIQNDLKDHYTANELDAIGISDSIVEENIPAISHEIMGEHFKEHTFAGLKKFAEESYRVKKRMILEDEARYQQILDSLPEDEPDREIKADYLFNGANLGNHDMYEYMDEIDSRAMFRVIDTADDLIHSDNFRNTTIGDVLSRVGLTDAEKEEFLKEHDYTSLDEKIYDHEIGIHPDSVRIPEKDIKSNVKSYLQSALWEKAYSEAAKKDDASSDPAERQKIRDWNRKKAEKANDADGLDRIQGWIKEKGENLRKHLQIAHYASTLQRSRLLLEGNKSLNDIGPNAPLQADLDRKKAETSYISEIIKGTKIGYNVVDELAREGAKKFAGLERKTAEEYINSIKRDFRHNKFDKDSDDYPAKQFADIFAARILSNSVRGKRDSLSEEFIRSEANEMSQKLMDNQDFRDFINNTYLDEADEDYKKLEDATHRLSSSRTHGGFIEDEFKKYLLKLPAGELKNSPELARFMPTAKERIEELKRQVKAHPEDKTIQENVAAEIIAIRNACKVERKTGYGLNRQIPPAEEGKTIDQDVTTLTGNPHLRTILGSDELRSSVLDGHGGQMMINVRKQYDENVMEYYKKPELEAVLKRNTVDGRMAELRSEVQGLKEKLASQNSKIRNEAMTRSKELLGEYVALADKGKYPQGRGNDAPWKDVDKVVKNSMKNPSLQAIMKTPEKAAEILDAVGSGDIETFQTKMSQEINALRAPKAQQPVQKQMEKEIEGPILPMG